MKITKILTFLTLLFFPALVIPSVCLLSSIELGNSDIKLFADNGVSDYDVNQSVTYEVSVDYEFTNLKDATLLHPNPQWEFLFRSIRYPDRQPDNPLSKFTPEYQEIDLSESTITGNTTDITIDYDEFNNTFDLFNASLGINQKVTIQKTYEIKLSEIYFDIDKDDVGDYNPTDTIHDLYCNVEEEFFNKADPNLIALSNDIVDSGDNPMQKAEDIYDWITENIDYKVQNSERGASWAYANMKGDCSEYSDLMITLLRIQNIPARKLTGIVITNDPTEIPEKDDEYKFSNEYPVENNDDDLFGHAWLEYYVPKIGWIVCDPTWGEAGLDYFERIDFFHLATTVGAYFLITGTNITISEYWYFPSPVYEENADFSYTCDVTFTVIDTDLKEPEEENIWELVIKIIVISAIIAAIAGIIVLVVRYERKKARKKLDSS